MTYTLTFCGSRGGKHVVKNIECFEHGIPGEIVYIKRDKYGIRRYGVPAHVVLSIVSDDAVIYEWNRNAKTPAIVNIATSLRSHGLSL